METDNFQKVIEKAEKLAFLEIMDKCIENVGKKNVTIKPNGDKQTHIYIGGEYFQTLPELNGLE